MYATGFILILLLKSKKSKCFKNNNTKHVILGYLRKIKLKIEIKKFKKFAFNISN